MIRRFKEARLQKKIKLTDASAYLEVAQSTLSSWEAGRILPGPESLVKMAELYGVSVDYLLGNSPFYSFEASNPIPMESYPIFHGKPVWSDKLNYVIINTQENVTVSASGEKIPLTSAGNLYFVSTPGIQTDFPLKKPLTKDEILHHQTVWVEPISQDITLREHLRGTYSVKGIFVENTRGVKFFLDSYGATWLAYEL